MTASVDDVLVETEAILTGQRAFALPNGGHASCYWIKSQSINHKGGFCLSGAISYAVMSLGAGHPVHNDVLRRVLDVMGGESIPEFNDDLGTTFNDILAIVRQARQRPQVDEMEGIPTLDAEPEPTVLV